MVVLAQGTLISVRLRMDRFISRSRDRLAAHLPRYIQFRNEVKRRAEEIRRLTEEQPRSFEAFRTEESVKENLIKEKYQELEEGLSNRLREVEENNALPEGAKRDLEDSIFDCVTLEEIKEEMGDKLYENEAYYGRMGSLLNSTLEEKRSAAAQYPARYRTTILIGKANSYVIPLPKKDEDEMKDEERMWITHGEILTILGEYTLRTLVRREQRDRRDIKIAVGLSLATLALGVWNAIGLHFKG